MRLLTLYLLLALLSIQVSAQTDSSVSLTSALQEAKDALTRNDYVSAEMSYRNAVTLQPGNAELWANLGTMQYENKEYSASILSFQHAQQLDPRLYVPYLFLGLDYLNTGKPAIAIPLLSKAGAMRPTDPQAAVSLGRAYRQVKDFNHAASAYRRATMLNTQDGMAWFSLGITRLRQVETEAHNLYATDKASPYAEALFAESLAEQSRYKEALDMYNNVLASDSRPPCMHSESGWVSLKQHDIGSAASDFQAESQINTYCALARMGEARVALDRGSNAEGLTILEQLWNRDPGFLRSNSTRLTDGMSPECLLEAVQLLIQKHTSGEIQQELYDFLFTAFSGPSEPPLGADSNSGNLTENGLPRGKHTAEEYYALGQYGDCTVRLQRGLKNNAALDKLLLLAMCSFFTGDYQLSEETSVTAESRYPRSLEAAYWSIKANEKLAFLAFSHFEQIQPDSEKTHLLLGDMYRQRKRYAAAEDEYKKAMAISPKDSAPLYGLGYAYFGDFKTDEAIAIDNAALAMSPDDPDFNLMMGEILVSRNSWSQAEPFLEKSLSVRPQVLSHVHALLGKVYAETGREQDAVAQLQMGLESDDDGSVHYRLARIYRRMGKAAEADATMAQVKRLLQKMSQRDRAAFQNPQPGVIDDEP